MLSGLFENLVRVMPSLSAALSDNAVQRFTSWGLRLELASQSLHVRECPCQHLTLPPSDDAMPKKIEKPAKANLLVDGLAVCMPDPRRSVDTWRSSRSKLIQGSARCLCAMIELWVHSLRPLVKQPLTLATWAGHWQLALILICRAVAVIL